MDAFDVNRMKSVIGGKYYKYSDDDTLSIVRIIGIKHSDTFKVLDYSKDDIVEMNVDLFIGDNKEYTMIKPDAMVGVYIVKINTESTGKIYYDTIVTVHNKAEMTAGVVEPFAVCRQNLNDIYNEFMALRKKIKAGCSISRDTIPAHLKFSNALVHNGIESSLMVNTYMEDDLDDILKCIKTKEPDRILELSYMEYCKTYNRVPDGNPVDGWCKTLRDLLDSTNFMFDYCAAVGVIQHERGISYIEEKDIMYADDDEKLYLSDMLRENIKTAVIVEYDKSIDLSKIMMKHIIVKTPDLTLWLIGYITEGQYIQVNKKAGEVVDFIKKASSK